MQTQESNPAPTAIVMNMFYTGLGVARSLWERGIPVIGLSAHREACGNFTRCAKVMVAPDSKECPDQLLDFLLKLRGSLPEAAIIFPTRDQDVLFLDRFRELLQPLFRLVLPDRSALAIALDKNETARVAVAAGMPTPGTWEIHSKADLLRILPDLRFPLVLKPVSAHHWRQGGNWQLVGNRKAIGVFSAEEMLEEYERIARADSRVLVQEMVPGGDDCLFIAACYFDQSSRFVAGFALQKLLQSPAVFGTGCIVQTIELPELVEMAGQFLERIGYNGIAEVEFKYDSAASEYKLIEINPRPWDQHRLGNACGVDLIYITYCDLARRPGPAIPRQTAGDRWIAEDVLLWHVLRSFWKRNGEFRSLLRMIRGHRVYSMWSWRDPLPFLGFFTFRFLPDLIGRTVSYLRLRIGSRSPSKRELPYEKCKS